MSTYYRTCPYCGANLDPGERCDCNFGMGEGPAMDAANAPDQEVWDK